MGDRALQLIDDIVSGLKYHKWKSAFFAFTCYSVIYTLVKSTIQFFPNVKVEGVVPFTMAVATSCAYGCWKTKKARRVVFKIANSNACLEIVFGDFFAESGVRALGVSEYFETQLGRPVSERSLHGSFIQRFYGGSPEGVDKQLESQLEAYRDKAQTKPEKIEGKRVCYPIGTTAVLKVGDDSYIWFAVAEADPATCKVSTDVELLWRALHRLWQRARSECNGHALNLPLIGSGLAGINLPTRDLLNLMILSAITESKAREVTRTIRIVLWTDRMDDVDLKEIKRYWEGGRGLS